IGKTLGTDLASGKFTLPLLLLLERLSPAERHEVVERMQDGTAETLGNLSGRLRETGVLEAVRARFEEELGRGEAALAPFAKRWPVDGLLACGQYVRGQMGRLQ